VRLLHSEQRGLLVEQGVKNIKTNHVIIRVDGELINLDVF